MAVLDPIRFGDVVLQLETTPGSGVFETLCGITEISRNFSINTQTEEDIDCEDPDAVTFESATKISVGEEVQFSGQVDVDASERIDDMAYAEADWNARLVYNKGSKVGYYAGPAILTGAGEAYSRRQRGTMSGTLKWTARPVWTAT